MELLSSSFFLRVASSGDEELMLATLETLDESAAAENREYERLADLSERCFAGTFAIERSEQSRQMLGIFYEVSSYAREYNMQVHQFFARLVRDGLAKHLATREE